MSSLPSSLMKKALDATASPVTIVDARREDMPIIYCNDAFVALTEYDRTEVIGKNCRFLQGEDTDSNNVELIRKTVKQQKDLSVTLLNYTKSGRQFWNDLQISPLFDDDGTLTHFMGFQNDITERFEKNAVNLVQQRAEFDVEMSLMKDKELKDLDQRKRRLAKIVNTEITSLIETIERMDKRSSDKAALTNMIEHIREQVTKILGIH